MRLTPIDLIHQRFPRAFRGYARAAVENYLRQVSADYEETVAENARLRDQVERLEREVERYRAMETTLKEALILAQKTADETRAAAQQEVERLLREAHAHVAALTEEAERSVGTLRQQRVRFAREFRLLLQSYLADLEADPARSVTPAEAVSAAAPSVHARTEQTVSIESDGAH